jgi:hypothetical protein
MFEPCTGRVILDVWPGDLSPVYSDRFACPADPDLIADFGAVTSLQRKSFVEGWNKLVSRINMLVKSLVSVSSHGSNCVIDTGQKDPACQEI